MNGPQLPVLPALDLTKSSARYQHQLITAATNLQIAATAEVLTWLLQTVGPTIRAALFDPPQGGHAHVAIVDVVAYLELHHSSLSSQDIFALNDILNAYNSDLSVAANFVKWDTVYATYTSHNINVADVTRIAHFSTAVNFNMVFKDRLSAFFMFRPLPQQHTYDVFKIFILVSDRKMAATTPASAGITSLPAAAAAAAAAAAVEKASPTSDMHTAFAAMQKQIKDLTATVSKLHVKAPDNQFVPPEGKCRKCWGPHKSALGNRDWSFCAEHNHFCVFAPKKK